MREDLVGLLRCPVSGQSLELVHIESCFELAGKVHVVEGVLAAATGTESSPDSRPQSRYPVIDEIPRLLAADMLSGPEKEFLDHHNDSKSWCRSPLEARRVEPDVVSDEQLEAEIRRRMEKQYDLPPASERQRDDAEQAASRRRCEGEIRYMTAECRGTNKEKYVRLLRPMIESGEEVASILETGGNFPGLTRSLAKVYKPSLAVVANIQILFPMAFKMSDRSIQAIRADVQALPFKDRGFDLVVTAFMLEHVPDWRKGLRCLMACGRRTFVAFGPNKWFPFEVGHLDAPLAGTLPKPLAARLTWLWLALMGRRRPLHRLQEILEEVFHVGSWAFARQARAFGGRVTNLFPQLVDGIVKDHKAPPTGPRKLLKRFPKLAGLAAQVLTRLGMEPQMYYWIEPDQV